MGCFFSAMRKQSVGGKRREWSSDQAQRGSVRVNRRRIERASEKSKRNELIRHDRLCTPLIGLDNTCLNRNKISGISAQEQNTTVSFVETRLNCGPWERLWSNRWVIGKQRSKTTKVGEEERVEADKKVTSN